MFFRGPKRLSRPHPHLRSAYQGAMDHDHNRSRMRSTIIGGITGRSDLVRRGVASWGASRISADFYGRKGLFEPIRAILNPLCPSAAEYGVLTWCAIRIAHHVNTPYSAAEGQSGFRMARIGSKSPFLP